MSINLHLEDESAKESFDLWQTPTYITRMCLWPENSPTVDILERYILWVSSQSQGIWTSKEDLDDMLLRIREHVGELRGWIKNHPEATFYAL